MDTYGQLTAVMMHAIVSSAKHFHFEKLWILNEEPGFTNRMAIAVLIHFLQVLYISVLIK